MMMSGGTTTTTANPSVYWGGGEAEFKGIVVVFAWLSSSLPDDHLRTYLHLYSSLSWNSLVCRSSFLHAFSSDKATSHMNCFEHTSGGAAA
ncbi:hypothetical protein MLD38_026821 [Melastoma candidum]|uniref:Uncharacterized protein n=1 Tax=Melastoma candidum TaxID=119954 RepID=A0ACB9P148_9MYRT|nr:hypothetical protein MLD38_026821 [Melastoma candidum]